MCRLHLYRGDTAEILAWLESAPDENREFYILERFRYVTKVRVYLQQGKYEAAYNLLQQLLYYAKEMERTYIRIESTLLLAVTCYKMDRKEWKNLLQEAVSEAESYHFVRILTKEAGLWLPLLKKNGRDTLDRSTLSQTGAGRRKKDGADVPWISQNKSRGRSHTFRYRTEDSADAGQREIP